MSGLVSGGTRLSSSGVQLRAESVDPGPGDPVPTAKRNVGQQSISGAPEVGKHVLHDQDAAEVGERVPEAVVFRKGAQQDDQGVGQRLDLHFHERSLFGGLFE